MGSEGITVFQTVFLVHEEVRIAKHIAICEAFRIPDAACTVAIGTGITAEPYGHTVFELGNGELFQFPHRQIQTAHIAFGH